MLDVAATRQRINNDKCWLCGCSWIWLIKNKYTRHKHSTHRMDFLIFVPCPSLEKYLSRLWFQYEMFHPPAIQRYAHTWLEISVFFSLSLSFVWCTTEWRDAVIHRNKFPLKSLPVINQMQNDSIALRRTANARHCNFHCGRCVVCGYLVDAMEQL